MRVITFSNIYSGKSLYSISSDLELLSIGEVRTLSCDTIWIVSDWSDAGTKVVYFSPVSIPPCAK